MDEIDWVARWRSIVEERDAATGGHCDPGYWDRRAPTFAKSTQGRADEFLIVIEPYLTARKTLIDVGAGSGRHSVPLASRLEWVTAVEPSEGMRAHIAATDNMTVVASTWEDAEVAPADLVICCHVMYGVADVAPFISKLNRSARERVFVMLRESDMPHPAGLIRSRLSGGAASRMPRSSDLFMVLVQLGFAPDVAFLHYPFISRYADMEAALVDCQAMLGEGWDDATARAVLGEVLVPDGDELVFNGGDVLTGVAHWKP